MLHAELYRYCVVYVMAATKRNRNKEQSPLGDKSRAKIQTTQLVKRLQDNALDKLPNEMSSGQIASAIALIDRTLPKLTATELTGKDGGPIAMESPTNKLKDYLDGQSKRVGKAGDTSKE